jgi:hypothetical protein
MFNRAASETERQAGVATCGREVSDMKMTFRTASTCFGVGAVAGAVLLTLAGSSNRVRCRTGDLTASVLSTMASSLQGSEYGWIRNARICDIGEYSVVIPEKNGSNGILLIRNGRVSHTLFAATADAVNLFDSDGKGGLRGLLVRSDPRSTAVFNAGGKGDLLSISNGSVTLASPESNRILASVEYHQSGSHSLTYGVYDADQAAWVENTVGPDGKIYLRTTETPGRPAKTEVRVGERWVETVKRDGKIGMIVNGQFMSVAEALAKLH